VEVVPLEPIVASLSIARRIGHAMPHQSPVHRLMPLSVVVDAGGHDNHELQRVTRLLVRRALHDGVEEELNRLAVAIKDA
jgi:hypothetical protein